MGIAETGVGGGRLSHQGSTGLTNTCLGGDGLPFCPRLDFLH